MKVNSPEELYALIQENARTFTKTNNADVWCTFVAIAKRERLKNPKFTLNDVCILSLDELKVHYAHMVLGRKSE